MIKSKVKSSNLRSTQGDFRLQTKRHAFALPTPRVQSRSCSPIQHGSISPSPTSIPPRTKVAFADFPDFSSAARVSSKRKNITMQKKGSPTPSLHRPSFGGRNGGSSSSFKARPLPAEHLTEHPTGFNPSGSHWCLGGLTPTSNTVPPPQSSSVRSHPLVIPFAVTPSLVGAPTLASLVTNMSQPSCNRGAPTNTPPGISNPQSPALVHFLEYASSASCHLQETDVSALVVKWKFCLIGYVARKFPGYASLY